MGKLRIVSHGGQAFYDREEAGRLLAAELMEWRGKKAVVLGVPRGGVVVAAALARELAAELDVVLAHKLRTPGHEELALGAVAEDGQVFLNQGLEQEMGVDNAYILEEKKAQLAEISRRIRLIRWVHPKVPLAGRVAIVTDDGIATGATFQAALWAVRQEHPEKLIAAIPVGPPETVKRLAADADEMLCLRAPPSFAAVGQFYERFEPVEDNELLEILKDESGR